MCVWACTVPFHAEVHDYLFFQETYSGPNAHGNVYAVRFFQDARDLSTYLKKNKQ